MANGNREPSWTTGRRHFGTLASCAFAVGTLALVMGTSALACNSGNVGAVGAPLLSDAACQATSVSIGTTAVGRGASATPFFSAAFGYNAFVHANWAGTAIGTLSSAGYMATAVGYGANATTDGATAVGARAGFGVTAGHFSTAIGASRDDFSFDTTSGPQASGRYSIAIGGGDTDGNAGARANDDYAIAIGTSSVGRGIRSVAFGAFAGNGAGASNSHNSAFGTESGRHVSGQGNTGLGLAAGHTISGNANSAFGNSAGQAVTGSYNTAGGAIAGSTVKGSYNTAYGESAGINVTGNSNVAIGRKSGYSVTAHYTVAIGATARATASQAVAIGYGSLATAVNTVSIGTTGNRRRIVNLAPGVAATDAVNVAQLQAATSAAAPSASIAPTGNVELAAMRALVQRLETRLDQQQARIAQLESRTVAEASTTAE